MIIISYQDINPRSYNPVYLNFTYHLKKQHNMSIVGIMLLTSVVE